MSKFRRECRGQFVILVAVIIAAFMFSLIHTIGQIGTSRQEVAYEPVDELALAIASDFERCLTRALAMATQNYSKTWNEISAKMYGEALIENWHRTLLASYNGFGINVTLKPSGGSGENIGWRIQWGNNLGTSMVYATFVINVGVYGLRNLAITMQRAVYLNILNWSDTGTVKFKVYLSGVREYRIPISDVTKVELYVNGARYDPVAPPVYIGQGEYVVRFNLPSGSNINNSMLLVTTSDDIIVGAIISGGGSGGGGGEGEGGGGGGGGESEEPNRDWRYLYISPKREKRREDDEKFSFLLVLDPPSGGQITPPLNNPFDSRSGYTIMQTPRDLTLGDVISIYLYAYYTVNASRPKQGRQNYIDVNVTLAYIDSSNNFVVIGFNWTRIVKSPTPLVYHLTFRPIVRTIPKGSTIVLTLTRLDNDRGGTLHIWCGEGSRIELW